MESNAQNNPDKRHWKDTKTNPNHKDLKPKFDEFTDPETIIDHVRDLTQPKATPHSEILDRLLDQIETVDFVSIANPYNVEKFKLNNKHYTVISIDNILKVAENNKWGLCKNHDFIYLFNGTFWEELSKETLQKFLGKASQKMGVPEITAKYHRFRKELYEQFLSTAFLESKPSLLDSVLINLLNGTFEIRPDGTQLRPFDRSDFLTYQLPFEFDPEAKAPQFEAYLNRVLPDIERQKVLAEYMGFLFIKHGSKRLKEEKALILYGTGANGKSVFFEIVSALLGAKNTSNYSLQSLTNNNGYFRAKLANKLVNYASEINGKLESSIFKQLVSGEPVEARLPYCEPFTLRQYAKLIFNCNDLPKDVEHTNAYFRRFIIIPFDVTIPPEEQDKQLHTKIIETELSGVFNWVLDGLKRLLEQKRFTDCEAIRQAVEQYKRQSDSVKMFIDENNYKSSPVEYRLIKELYNEYRIFCNEDGFIPVNKSNFMKRLLGIGILVDRKNVGNVAYLSTNKNPF